MIYSIQQTPGRIRVCTPALKQRAQAHALVQHAMQSLVGIRRIRCNTTLGSVIVYYDAQTLSAGAIINRLASADLLTGVIGFPTPIRKHPDSRIPPSGKRLRSTENAPNSSPLVKAGTRALIRATTRWLLPIVAERAFGRVGRVVVSAML